MRRHLMLNNFKEDMFMIELLLFVAGVVVFVRSGRLLIKVINSLFTGLENAICIPKRKKES